MVSKKLAVVIAVLSSSPTAQAQQPLPRPIVLYRSSPTATQSVQWTPSNSPTPVRQPANSTQQPRPATFTVNPNAANVTSNGARPNPVNSVPGNAWSNNAVQQAGSSNPLGTQAETKQKTPEEEWAEQQTRPTNQMLQNPSGAFNMSHSGMSSSQQMAPNTYLGPQFQNWTNQQPVAQMPASFGEMSRLQPGPFGGYVSPNTYVGSGFSSWNNLSQGGNAPGATGSWSFSVWP